VLRATITQKAKIRGIYLALKTPLGLNELKYSLPIADSRLFMNLAVNERPSFTCRIIRIMLPLSIH
jgi:hypothetical protein